jgi:hypothetical protein
LNPQEVRQLIAERTLSLPYSIVTRGGLAYRVADHANAFITPAYPDTLIIAIPGKGIVYLGLSAIAAIHNEHEAVSAHE